MTLRTLEVDVPEELIDLLRRSKIGDRPVSDQLRILAAIHLQQEGLISVGKAAEIAGEPRATFEQLLAEMGIPALRYGIEDYERDKNTIDRLLSD